jgi:hypothetical protein
MQRKDFFKQMQSQTKMGVFVGLVFGLVFLGIGITVIVWMWTAQGFGAPPLVFRVFATLIAIPFVAVGGATAYSAARALRGGYEHPPFGQPPQPLEELPLEDKLGEGFDRGGQVGYTCPGCGAPLARGADVSPHGDVKCGHCGRWFNVHKSRG